MKKALLISLMAALAVSVLFTGCTGKSKAAAAIKVDFWTAPNQGQYNYWDAIIQEFNAASITVDGKSVQIAAQMMPEMPSSEAGIQNALATNSAPALSENINRGFAATLAASGRVYDIQNEQFFKDIVANRQMATIVPGWAIEGKQYVIPVYANPMGYHWNARALRELGFTDKVPATVADMRQLMERFRSLRNTRMKELGITHTFLRPALVSPENWWERWFDFEMQYNAFSGGKPMVESGRLVIDQAITKDVLEYFGLFGDTLQLEEDITAFELDRVPAVVQITAPWDIAKYEAAGKVYGMNGDYVYGPPIVKKDGDIPYTFGDAKGLVFYKGGNVTDEQHRGAVAFISWVYSAERSSKSDLDWFTTTSMLPMRGDISTNPTFAASINKEVYKSLGDLMKYAMPAMAADNATDILTAIGEGGLTAYVLESAKNTALTPLDAASFAANISAAMKKAGSLE